MSAEVLFSKIKIRDAVLEDLPSIGELLCELGYPQHRPDILEKTFNEISLNLSMGILIATTEENEILGFISYSIKPLLRLTGLSMEVDEMSVFSRCRGHGIGAHLMKALKEIAAKLQVKRIILSTNRERESYRRSFYPSQGFSELDSAWMQIKF